MHMSTGGDAAYSGGTQHIEPDEVRLVLCHVAAHPFAVLLRLLLGQLHRRLVLALAAITAPGQ